MGCDNMAEDMVEVLRTGLFMERIRREDLPRNLSLSRRCAGDPQRPRTWQAGRRLAGGRQQGRPDHGRPAARHMVPVLRRDS